MKWIITITISILLNSANSQNIKFEKETKTTEVNYKHFLASYSLNKIKLENGNYKSIEKIVYENDTIRNTVKFSIKNNLLHGEFKIINPENNLLQLGNYIKGKKHGHFKYFNKYNRISRLVKYRRGREIDFKEFSYVYVKDELKQIEYDENLNYKRRQ